MKAKDFNDNYEKIKGFDYTNGIIIDSVSKDEVVAHVDLEDKSYNPWNFAHGGLIFGLCDTAIGILCYVNKDKCVTIDANINYLKPCKKYIKAVATKIKIGKNISLFKADVYNEKNELSATATMNYYNYE